MALRGVKVLELAGLAPAPYCGMILADFGADVIRVDRTSSGGGRMDRLCRGKRSIAVDLKNKEGIDVVKKLASQADVLVEPFRKGVMEKLGLGPSVLLKDNPRLVYTRLTGFGQDGPLADRAGHDINYLAISGTLSILGRHKEKPLAPLNLLADFAGGGLMCAMGVTMALYNRTQTGKGQVIDSNMVEGAAYVGSFIWGMKGMQVIGEERGTGVLDSGSPWYDTYETKDGMYMSVGAIEPQFYAELLKGLGLNPEDCSQFDNWDQLREKFTSIFKSKTQKEWNDIFEGTDACVMPVVPAYEAHKHPHNVARASFITQNDGTIMPKPAPLLSESTAVAGEGTMLQPGQHTSQVLQQFGYSSTQVNKLIDSGAVMQNPEAKL